MTTAGEPAAGWVEEFKASDALGGALEMVSASAAASRQANRQALAKTEALERQLADLQYGNEIMSKALEVVEAEDDEEEDEDEDKEDAHLAAGLAEGFGPA